MTDPRQSEQGRFARDALKTLQETVGGLNLDNFIVRHIAAWSRSIVADAWRTIDEEKREELMDEIAPLPASRSFGTEEAKRFDLLIFSLQLALLKGSKRFDTLQKAAAARSRSALEEQTGIPAIAHQAALIEEIQTDQWWKASPSRCEARQVAAARS